MPGAEIRAEKKRILFRERTKRRNSAPFGGQHGFVGVVVIGCPALKEVLNIS